MGEVLFTSDTHWNHARCCFQFRAPRFASVEEMNETLVQRWNARVGKGDQVYHLGDFALGRADDAAVIAARLNGQIYLIRGNHEHVAEHKKVRDRFVWIKDYHGLKVGDQKVYLFHYPMLSWNCMHYGSWHLHGHCHGNLPDNPTARRLDVGVDCWDFYPVSFEEIAARMALKAFVPVDHHTEEKLDA